MRLIDADALKKAFDKWWGCDDIPATVVEDLIDNAPTVAVNCKDCDGYEAGYSAGVCDTERPKGEIFPMEIVAGKCPIDANEDCPLRPQGEFVKMLKERITESVCKWCQMNKHCEICEISRVFMIIDLTDEERKGGTE